MSNITILVMGIIMTVTFVICMWAKTHFKLQKVKNKNRDLERNFQRMLSQKKSSEVRVGKIGENMAPFLQDWPYDPNSFRFLGNPVDGIQFTPNEVIFIEIKTGKSKLTKTQKRARDLVNAGKVSFATFRINEEGATLTKEDVEEN